LPSPKTTRAIAAVAAVVDSRALETRSVCSLR
jgi:hypothetical protein